MTNLPAVVQLPGVFPDRNSGGKVWIDDDDQLVRALPIEIRKLTAETIGGTWVENGSVVGHIL